MHEPLSIDACITDPPYSAHTHNKQRRGCTDYVESKNGNRKAEFNRVRDLGFKPLDDITRHKCAQEFWRLVRKWVIVFSDDDGLTPWREDMSEVGFDWIRTMVWIKKGATPQFSGDRPAQGHEYMLLFHRPGKKRWNGGGKHGVYECPIVLDRDHSGKRVHTAQKPTFLMESLVRDFTEPNDLVLDPFCGSGTTGVACRRLGRRFVGYEKDKKYADIAQKRIDSAREQREFSFA